MLGCVNLPVYLQMKAYRTGRNKDRSGTHHFMQLTSLPLFQYAIFMEAGGYLLNLSYETEDYRMWVISDARGQR